MKLPALPLYAAAHFWVDFACALLVLGRLEGGGDAVTAKVDAAMKAVPAIPTETAAIVGRDVFSFSRCPISSTQASKFRCSLVSSVLLIIFRSLFRRITFFFRTAPGAAGSG